jgi:hypothetical protein
MFVSPKLHVPEWMDRLVFVFVFMVGFNYACQLFLAAAYYDVAKVEEDGTHYGMGVCDRMMLRG